MNLTWTEPILGISNIQQHIPGYTYKVEDLSLLIPEDVDMGTSFLVTAIIDKPAKHPGDCQCTIEKRFKTAEEAKAWVEAQYHREHS